MKKIIYLILFVLLCEGAGLVGSYFTISQISTWYAHLVKPTFSPPSWLFGPVWITLYALMGLAMFLVFMEKDKPNRMFALWFFTVHLAINALWSIMFFGLHQIGWAVVVIAILWLMIAASIFLFGKINKWAAWLLVPYLAWVSFASVLNLALWSLNK